MIDVHPPHQPIHGWRDFSLHIATITIGLLIALGLEAIAEAIHHRHQVAETRESLRSEREENHRRFAANIAYQLRQGASLTNNLLVLEFLQQHPGTPESQLPGFLRWTSSNARMTQSAWKTAQQTGVFAFMPRDEVQKDAELYDFLERIDQAHEDEADATLQAMMYMIHDPDPSHLTAVQISQEVGLTRNVLIKSLRHGFLMEDLAAEYPEFTPAPTRDQLLALLHLQEKMGNKDLQTPMAITKQRVDAASPPPSSDPAASR